MNLRKPHFFESNIKEIARSNQMLQDISFDSFVAYDIDNTIMESTQELASDQWFCQLMKYANAVMSDKKEAKELVLVLYCALQHHVKTQAVEKNTISIIKILQDIHIPVLAITARNEDIMKPTLKQLANIEINFARQWGDVYFVIQIDNNLPSVVFKNGIIFCSGVDKGKCLKAFLEFVHSNHEEFKCIDIGRRDITVNVYDEILKKLPTHLIMIDDNLKNLILVQQSISDLFSRVTGLRYSYLDKKVETFDMKKATAQLMELYGVLSQDAQFAIQKLNIHSFFQYYHAPGHVAQQALCQNKDTKVFATEEKNNSFKNSFGIYSKNS